MYLNGSSHREGTGIGVLIVSPKGIPTKFKFRIGENCSNNEAECEALITELKILVDLGEKRVVIRGDSKLVLKYLAKEYKSTKENLVLYSSIAQSFLKKFDLVEIRFVPKLKNQEKLFWKVSHERWESGKLDLYVTHVLF